MKIRFSDLISKRERKKSISYKFNIDPFNFEGEMIKPVSEVEVEGLATSDDEIVIIKAHIKCDLEINPDLCEKICQIQSNQPIEVKENKRLIRGNSRRV